MKKYLYFVQRPDGSVIVDVSVESFLSDKVYSSWGTLIKKESCDKIKLSMFI